MSDADKTHRWLTQAQLDAMLADARARGAAEGSDLRRKAEDLVRVLVEVTNHDEEGGLADAANRGFERGYECGLEEGYSRGLRDMRDYLAKRLPEVGLPPSTTEIIWALPDPEER